MEGIKTFLPQAKGPVDSQAKGPFSVWAPAKPIFADFGLPADGSQDAAWWARRQAVAYLFGIHPIFTLMAPELSEEKLLEFANIGQVSAFPPKPWIKRWPNLSKDRHRGPQTVKMFSPNSELYFCV